MKKGGEGELQGKYAPLSFRENHHISKKSKFMWLFCHEHMAYDAFDSGQVDLQTQQGYSKYGPVAFTSLINDLTFTTGTSLLRV